MLFGWLFKKNKNDNDKEFFNKPCKWNGLEFDSQLEKQYAQKLEYFKNKGVIRKYIRAKSYPLIVNGYKICDIEPDFTVILKNRKKEAHEVKCDETMTHVWYIKSRLFKALYPKIKYKIIK